MTLRFLAAGGLLLGLGAAFAWTGLPPVDGGAVTAGRADHAGVVLAAGAIHIHTRASDGGGSIDDVVSAAKKAGLQYVVVTDHGDAFRRPPAPPRYVDGVLCLDGVEISTDAGHYLSIGGAAAPYPLAGDGRGVVEDVRRLGGAGFVAHPDSPKSTLAWHDWEAPVDGLEWLNLDSEWRDEPSHALARALLGYGLRSPQALASLLDRPTATLARIDAIGRLRRVAIIAGVDAHARIGTRGASDPIAPGALAIPLPSYEAALSVFRQYVELASPLEGDPVADATRVVSALRDGRSFTAVTALAPLEYFRLSVLQRNEHRPAGTELWLEDGAASLAFEVAGPSAWRMSLVHDGKVVFGTEDRQASWPVGAPGVYRVEVSIAAMPGEPPVPWLVSNPVFVRERRSALEVAAREDDGAVELFEPLTESPGIEADPVTSRDMPPVASRSPVAGGVSFGFQLARTVDAPWAAVAFHLPEGEWRRRWSGVRVKARASRPMRVSVQLRATREAASEWRWRASLYVDEAGVTSTLPLERFRPVRADVPTMAVDLPSALLLVADSVNFRPGDDGRLEVDSLALVGR